MYAGVFSLNGTASFPAATGSRIGLLTTPIALTNTHSLGIVHDAMIDYCPPRKMTAPRTGCRSWAKRGRLAFRHQRDARAARAFVRRARFGGVQPGGGRLRQRRHRHDPP
ncbi:MAG: P1 family peptidase [Bilophila wadsworthia]